MPQLAGKAAAGGSQTKNYNAYENDPPRLPAIAKATGQRRQKAINDDTQRQHDGGAAPNPLKLVTYNNPAIKKGESHNHNKTLQLTPKLNVGTRARAALNGQEMRIVSLQVIRAWSMGNTLGLLAYGLNEKL